MRNCCEATLWILRDPRAVLETKQSIVKATVGAILRAEGAAWRVLHCLRRSETAA